MYEVLNTNSGQWEGYISELPDIMRDVYFTPEYYRMHEANGEGEGRCFVYRSVEGIALYPFLLNRIDGYEGIGECYDIQTAYGYGGPVSTSTDQDFLKRFEESFLDYCRQNRIIAEFIRFHPFIRNEGLFSQKINVLHNRTTVYIDLKKGIDQIWQTDISSKNRNMIRKAQKQGLIAEATDNFEGFMKIYSKTMDKVGAGDYYYFSPNYFECLRKSKNYVLFNVKYDDIIIAAAVFLKYGKYFHYHLSGSCSDYLSYAPNNLLLWEAIKFACNDGADILHFGGGLTDSTEDSLFKFKNSFSKSLSGFYIGKRVHNSEIYRYLTAEWERKACRKADILLQYREKPG